MPKRFVDPWGVVVLGGDIEPSTIIGKFAQHKDGDNGLILEVDEVWPGEYMLSIGDDEGNYLTDKMENFYLMEELSEQEIEALDRRLGEQFAQDVIALARRLYEKPEKQARELRYWYEVAGAFPCHEQYSKPLLAAEINRLES